MRGPVLPVEIGAARGVVDALLQTGRIRIDRPEAVHDGAAGVPQAVEIAGDGVDQNDVEFSTEFPYLAAPKPGANPDAGYGSQLKALAGADGSDTLPSFSGDGSGDDDDGMSALVWILIGVAALGLIAVAYRAGRGSGGATS